MDCFYRRYGKLSAAWWATALFCGVSSSCWAMQYQGHVIFVADGDTVIMQDLSGVTHKIRLVGIDAPEKEQHYGEAARQQLQNMLGKHILEVETHRTDSYGRELGTLWLRGEDVNLAQIRTGAAWHYRRFASQQPLAQRLNYAEAEQGARQAKLGLWADSQPTAPWDFRQHQRGAQARQKVPWQAHFTWFYRWWPW